MLLYEILAFTIYGNNIKKLYQNNKFKIPAATWNGEFELHYGSYSASDIQCYFEYIINKHETVTDNPDW